MVNRITFLEWSEQSSVGTLRSVSITTPEPQPHLPSYLSLACTVSGYSTTTNYDPERLSKSRDASPHRLHDDLTPFTPPNRNSPNYSIRNNLLSPPNLVPLPNQKYLTSDSPQNNHNMEEQILTRHKFYSSTTTTTISSKESKKYIKNIYSSDSIDGCVSNGHPNGVSSKYGLLAHCIFHFKLFSDFQVHQFRVGNRELHGRKNNVRRVHKWYAT